MKLGSPELFKKLQLSTLADEAGFLYRKKLIWIMYGDDDHDPLQSTIRMDCSVYGIPPVLV